MCLIFPVLADYQVHTALGATARLVPNNFGVHGAGIFGRGIFVSVFLLVFVTVVVVVVLALLFVIMAMFMIVAAFRSLLPRFACYQIHATFGATARLVFDNFRVHRADVLDFDVQDGGIKILR